MIRFFRKIRQQLFYDNNIRKYVSYAIGEIVLVVIGILIALSINNWNQDRIDRQTERKYLINIKREIQSNARVNQALIEDRMTSKIQGLLLAKEYCEKRFTVSDTLDFLNRISFGGVFSGGFLFGEESAYNELINTGNLQLIENDSIKDEIANYYGFITAYNERSKIHSGRYSSYTSELRPFDPENPSFISRYDQIEMIKALQSNAFRKLVDLELSYAYKIREYVEDIKSIGSKTIQSIDGVLSE